MKWRVTQSESRKRYIEKFDAEEVDRYETWVLQLTREDEEACLADIARVFQFREGIQPAYCVSAFSHHLPQCGSKMPQ